MDSYIDENYGLLYLPLSFWDYALESATHILNMVPTKKVDKTPYELWYGKVPNLSYLKVERTHRAPNRLCLNVEADEHSLGDFNEPTSYKATMLDSESNKWIDAMNTEMQSMIDNMVWVLVDLPPNCKTVGSKWIFNKKTDIDGIVHTYKAHLVAKGYTQLFGVDYEETFSPVVDIRAIRILISIAAFYDYEIWKMDVKTAFLNGYLDEDIYMVQPEGFVDPNHPRKVFCYERFVGSNIYRMDNSKRSHIPMQERPGLNKTQGASTPEEVKRIQNVPYASAVGSIINTKDMFLAYGGNPKAELQVDCYCDARFKTDRDDTKSQTGYVFILNGGTVDWKSSKQSTTAMYATEAEYIAASEAAMEAVWIRKFILGLGIVPTINEPIKMFCDNSVPLHFANEPGVQKGTRHYHRRFHYVPREY
ncbi:retrovirus-related pol polyprotein from transposon TNT 1-94 [Tanacetum coccineum]